MFHFWIYFFLLILYAVYLSLALGFGNTEGTDSISFFFLIPIHFNCSSFDVKLRFQILKSSRGRQFSQQVQKYSVLSFLSLNQGDQSTHKTANNFYLNFNFALLEISRP